MRTFQVLLAAAWLVFFGTNHANSQQRPNILLITVDDMNCDSVGVYGCPVDDITPNIDRLAAEGMRFEHAHVTIAICQPTRAVWMTGRYPHRNGALGFDPILADVPTLMETLHDAGYYTGIMGKVPHVVPTRKAAWDMIVPADDLDIGRNPKLYGKKSAKFLQDAAKADKPFFLMANSQDPHRPFAGSDQERNRKLVRPAQRFPGVRRTYKPHEVPVPGFLPDLPEVKQEMAEYYSSVHRADEIVGALLASLDASGKANETIVMFLSDHGMPLPFAKTNCYRHSTKTPWIVRWPDRIEANSVHSQRMISGIDLAPTLLDLAGLPSLPGADGTSFMPTLLEQAESATGDHQYVFTYINRTSGRNEYPMRSVQDKRYGYIFNGWANGQTEFKNESQSGRTMAAMRQAAKKDEVVRNRVALFLYRTPEEFYDYQSDPDALHNLADSSEHAELIQQFRRLLLEHLTQTDDPALASFQNWLETHVLR